MHSQRLSTFHQATWLIVSNYCQMSGIGNKESYPPKFLRRIASKSCAMNVLAQIDPHRLGLCVRIKYGVAHFSAVAALFIATKGRGGVELVVRVGPDDACFERRCHAVNLPDVAGPDASSQPVDRPVGARRHFFDVLEWQRHHDRPKDLFARYCHLVLDVVKDGRLYKIARQLPAFGTSAASRCSGAFTLAGLDIAGDALQLLLRD